MSRGRVIGAVAGGLGLAAAGTAFGVVHQARSIGRRRPSAEDEEHRDDEQAAYGPDGTPTFGRLRSRPLTVVADDGVPLHVEVDEVDGVAARAGAGPAPTVVLVHGYCLQLDCWHFQRAAYRGRLRTVLYDQRSHGRSGRSAREHATIAQLGRDLLRVLEEVVPDGPVVLVGHSMGGMSVISLLVTYPELLEERVVGVALVATTAGGLDPGRILLPLLPARLSGELTGTAVSTLRLGHRAVDSVRRLGKIVARVGTDVLAFGDPVPASYVDFVDRMLASTPFEVVSDFFPSFRGFDEFGTVGVLARVPTVVVCGTADRLTSIGHSRKLHQRIPGSRLVELEGAGHLVLLERHAEVTAAIDDLLDRAQERLAS
ncbi:alpha/beta fold hydrolase [Nocardioides sp. AX2bis]|uniref:alpha/beta fold hydrolase n=1 Tax=Nocardioides sp. AX2bis TaxID=2653157 RepID=UPI0012F083BA|nr:alpha/beta hydrolase [Nocardioides sp. AX2bis]VXB01019.1 Pimeloyl-ACP methyl ester carboxylesterase [Nocardioides sp. AX2bis]